MHRLILLFPLLLVASISGANVASVQITGRFFCNGTPYRNMKVEIYEKNYVLRDLPGALSKTDENGYFFMKAVVKDSIYSPKPYFYMINWCREKQWWYDGNGDIVTCSEPLKVYMPPEYISEGREPKTTYDFHDLELLTADSEYHGVEWIFQGALKQKGECRRIKPHEVATDPYHSWWIPRKSKSYTD